MKAQPCGGMRAARRADQLGSGSAQAGVQAATAGCPWVGGSCPGSGVSWLEEIRGSSSKGRNTIYKSMGSFLGNEMVKGQTSNMAWTGRSPGAQQVKLSALSCKEIL